MRRDPKSVLQALPSRLIMGSGREELTILIEFCVQCESHTWCTNHNSEKYKTYSTQVEKAISDAYPNVRVRHNAGESPKGVRYPRLGAFEVTTENGQVLFSKLGSQKWPSVPLLLSKINKLLGGSEIEENLPAAAEEVQNGGGEESAVEVDEPQTLGGENKATNRPEETEADIQESKATAGTDAAAAKGTDAAVPNEEGTEIPSEAKQEDVNNNEGRVKSNEAESIEQAVVPVQGIKAETKQVEEKKDSKTDTPDEKGRQPDPPVADDKEGAQEKEEKKEEDKEQAEAQEKQSPISGDVEVEKESDAKYEEEEEGSDRYDDFEDEDEGGGAAAPNDTTSSGPAVESSSVVVAGGTKEKEEQPAEEEAPTEEEVPAEEEEEAVEEEEDDAGYGSDDFEEEEE